MRLGLDLLFLLPDETGGRETYARELVTAMFELEPALSATAFVNRDAPPGLGRQLAASLRVVRVPISARRPDQWAVGELALLPVAAQRARIDILHSLANFAPVHGRVRRVITVHDLQYRAVPTLLTPLRRAGTAAMLETAIRRADRVITVSSFGRQELIRELSVPPARIDVIPNGLGARRRAEGIAEPELRERHRLGSRPVALAVASDLPHKNLGALIEALTLIPVPDRPILVITGPGTDAGRLSAAARAADVHEDVRLLGFRPPEELEGLYTLASCVVLPSLYEGFGLPVLEAMSRGVPVACSDIPVLREVAGVAALFFPPTAAGQIASAIGRLTRDEALRRRAADAGRRHAATFTWAKAAQATLDCYRRTLEVGRPAA